MAQDSNNMNNLSDGLPIYHGTDFCLMQGCRIPRICRVRRAETGRLKAAEQRCSIFLVDVQQSTSAEKSLLYRVQLKWKNIPLALYNLVFHIHHNFNAFMRQIIKFIV